MCNFSISTKKALRKQARQLENEIDSKLVGFSKLCSNFATASITNRNTTIAASSQSTQSSSDLLFITLSNEIEDSLKKLNVINGKMSESLNSDSNNDMNSVANSGNVYTLQVKFGNILSLFGCNCLKKFRLNLKETPGYIARLFT